MTKKVLIIGGGGFLGLNIISKLINAGYSVTVLDRSKINRDNINPSVKYIYDTYTNYELIKKLLLDHKDVVHLAYASKPNTIFDRPFEDLLSNLQPSLTLFSIIAESNANLIFISSGGTIYGESMYSPIDENHSTKPISSYGLTKLTIENYIYLLHETQNLKYICLRPSNIYGIGQLPYLGQGFISTAIAESINGNSIKIFGEKPLIRDYLYVSDLVNAVYLALSNENVYGTFNIGSGIGLSNFDVVDLIKPILNKDKISSRIEILPKRIFDVESNILDSSKFHNLTGWLPEVKINDGLQLTYQWLKKILKYENYE